MKNLCLFFAGILLISACGQITEEITLNNDGSGEYMMYADLASSMGEMMKGFMTMSAGDSISEEEINRRVIDMIWKDFGESIDSVYTMNDKIPDSLELTDIQRKLIPNIQGFIKGTKKENQIKSGLKVKFSSPEEFQEFFHLIEDSQQGENAVGSLGKSSTDIKMTKNSISRVSTFTKDTEKEGGMETQMLLPMMKEVKIRTIIHLPKKAKKVTGQTLVENTGSKLIFEYNVFDWMEGKVDNGFSIEF